MLLIDLSWEAIRQNPDAMVRFYDHLFAIAPETRHFFSEDNTKQSEKLAYTLGFLVVNLRRLEEIRDAIEDLGRFHNRLQIEDSHYGHLKIALIETIKEIMGANYTEDVGAAWDSVLEYVSNIMINAPEKRKKRFKKLLTAIFE